MSLHFYEISPLEKKYYLVTTRKYNTLSTLFPSQHVIPQYCRNILGKGLGRRELKANSAKFYSHTFQVGITARDDTCFSTPCTCILHILNTPQFHYCKSFPRKLRIRDAAQERLHTKSQDLFAIAT